MCIRGSWEGSGRWRIGGWGLLDTISTSSSLDCPPPLYHPRPIPPPPRPHCSPRHIPPRLSPAPAQFRSLLRGIHSLDLLKQGTTESTGTTHTSQERSHLENKKAAACVRMRDRRSWRKKARTVLSFTLGGRLPGSPKPPKGRTRRASTPLFCFRRGRPLELPRGRGCGVKVVASLRSAKGDWFCSHCSQLRFFFDGR